MSPESFGRIPSGWYPTLIRVRMPRSGNSGIGTARRRARHRADDRTEHRADRGRASPQTLEAERAAREEAMGVVEPRCHRSEVDIIENLPGPRKSHCKATTPPPRGSWTLVS